MSGPETLIALASVINSFSIGVIALWLRRRGNELRGIRYRLIVLRSELRDKADG